MLTGVLKLEAEIAGYQRPVLSRGGIRYHRIVEQTNLGLYRNINEACFDWIQKWGLSLAFALTQSPEAAEQAVAEALVAVLTAGPAQGSVDGATRFATLIYDIANLKAFRGFTHDEFFKISLAARAAVVLKVKGRFSRVQIAAMIRVPVADVEHLLEGARLGFSKGRTWLAGSPARRQLDDARLIDPCPDWQGGRLFAHYIESEISLEQARDLHGHFLECTRCRSNLIQFKNTYADWLLTLPELEMTKATIHYFEKTARMVRQAGSPLDRRIRVSSPVPGLKRLIEDRPSQILLLGFALLMILHHLMRVV